jgi:ketosteroid isomerase-like protein
MPPENVEIVRSVFEAYLRGDEAGWLARTTPDIVVSQFPDQLDFRAVSGHAGLREVMSEWVASWDDWSIELLRATDVGGQVLVIARQRGRGRTSGAPMEAEVAFLFTLQGAQISRWQMFRTEAEALQAAEPNG